MNNTELKIVEENLIKCQSKAFSKLLETKEELFTKNLTLGLALTALLGTYGRMFADEIIKELNIEV